MKKHSAVFFIYLLCSPAYVTPNPWIYLFELDSFVVISRLIVYPVIDILWVKCFVIRLSRVDLFQPPNQLSQWPLELSVRLNPLFLFFTFYSFLSLSRSFSFSFFVNALVLCRIEISADPWEREQRQYPESTRLSGKCRLRFEVSFHFNVYIVFVLRSPFLHSSLFSTFLGISLSF